MLRSEFTHFTYQEIYQMIQVCPELEKRLDAVWQRLQLYKHEHRSMSQIDLDEACVECLESTMGYLEASAHNSGFNKQTGWFK